MKQKPKKGPSLIPKPADRVPAETTINDRAACRRKRRFALQVQADVHALQLINRRGRFRPDYLRSYRCPVCDGWHLTHRQLPPGKQRPDSRP